MILKLSAHIVFILFITWRAAMNKTHRNIVCAFGLLVVVCLGIELYREVMIFRGAILPITPERERMYRITYLSLGLYYGEVIHHAKKIKWPIR